MIIQLDGPEIVLVDIDTYKFYHKSFIDFDSETNTWKNKLRILVDVCWFNQTQVESEEVTIDIVWKGTLYTVQIPTITYNVGCCENPVLEILVDLNTNSVSYIEYVNVPVLTLYNLPAIRSDFNMSFGYIKMNTEEYARLYDISTQKPIQTLTNIIEIDGINGNKKHILYKNMICKSENDVENALDDYWTFIDDDTIYTAENSIVKNEIYLDWEDKIKLNNKEFKLYNFKQLFLSEMSGLKEDTETEKGD